MPSNKSVSDAPILQFTNCRILRSHQLQRGTDQNGADPYQARLIHAPLYPHPFLVLVTDAIAGMGLAPGRHTLGQQVVEVDGLNTYIAVCDARPFRPFAQFHHRDPGIVGLLTSDQIPARRRVFYGMISDGIHTNPAALRIAHRARPKGLVLVTDAIAGMGLAPGRHTLGQQVVEVDGLNTYIAGTKTLSGSVATMDSCVRHFQEATGCSVETALEAASLHPAQLLGMERRKGTLSYNSDADFLLLDDSLHVRATFIAGERVWSHDGFAM
nr:N-acetylglucosamine-6-phosphate deacetylase [Pelodiscus sinensis]|eukprot:XP_006121781.2 N-acetylglucosamine-6-phosphate deacetylase [Pelodiscus sinensis]